MILLPALLRLTDSGYQAGTPSVQKNLPRSDRYWTGSNSRLPVRLTTKFNKQRKGTMLLVRPLGLLKKWMFNVKLEMQLHKTKSGMIISCARGLSGPAGSCEASMPQHQGTMFFFRVPAMRISAV